MIRLSWYYDEDEFDYENLKNLDNIDVDQLDWDEIAFDSPNELFTPEFVEKYRDKITSSYYILERSDLDEKYGFLDYILSNIDDEESNLYSCISELCKLYSIVSNNSNPIKLEYNLFKIKNKLIELSKKGVIDKYFGIILEGSRSDILEYYRTHWHVIEEEFSLYDLILIRFGNKYHASIITDDIYYELTKQNIMPKFEYFTKLICVINSGKYFRMTEDKLKNIEAWLKDEPIYNLEFMRTFDGINLERDGKLPEDFRKYAVESIINHIKRGDERQHGCNYDQYMFSKDIWSKNN